MQITKNSHTQQYEANDLTIILPTFGRDEFTKRFLLHCQKSKCPFHIIIGDGKPKEENKKFLLNKSNFPNLSYEYHAFDDKSYYYFYKKMNKLAGLVKTKYVMQADNDDLIIFDGLYELLEKIKKKNNYIMARGGIAEFTTQRNYSNGALHYFGKIKSPSYTYKNNSPKKNIRIKNSIKYAISTYYNVIETRVLKKVLAELEVCNFTDLLNHELYFSARMYSFGQEYFNPSIVYYARQSGTTLNLHNLNTGWSNVFMKKSFFRDFSILKFFLTNASDNKIKEKNFIVDLTEAYRLNLSGRIMSLHDFYIQSNLLLSASKLFYFLVSNFAKKIKIKFFIFFVSLLPNFLKRMLFYLILRFFFSVSKEDANVLLDTCSQA